MTLQEMFNFITTALTLQGEKSVAYNFKGQVNSCMYRGDKGLKCAVGQLIPDALYDPAMDKGIGVQHLLDAFPRLAPHLLASDVSEAVAIDFLEVMQATHDQCDPNLWPERFVRIADRFKLQYDAVTATV